jgi:transposase-like protein
MKQFIYIAISVFLVPFRGRMIKERWVFGGYCQETKTGFLQLVPNRSAATLLPLVEQNIAPGSIILSDEWRAYNGYDILVKFLKCSCHILLKF